MLFPSHHTPLDLTANLASDFSGRRLVRIVSPYPHLPVIFLFPLSVPFGYCVWSFWPQTGQGFQHCPNSLPLPLLPLCPSYCRDLRLERGWLFWPQTGQERHRLHSIHCIHTKRVLWPQTGPGCCFQQLKNGTPYKTTS